MKLVIVESPAKAQTIRGYLGDEYQVEASVGHVRDLPTPSALPKTMKNGPYSKFAVDVEGGFKPYYQVHTDKKKRVAELRKALKDADELFLATDEDREGEAIAWHLLEVLKPKVPVKRMVFHEITKDAIQGALANTRDIDQDLVDAQETRRILDRLYGYEVSPVLWRKVAPSLSAGRVQSVATRLVVDREQERMAHVSAEYWSLAATVIPTSAEGDTERAFGVKINALNGAPIAASADFGDNGLLTEKANKAGTVVLDSGVAERLAVALEDSRGTVTAVTQKPYRRRPAAPFTTSTLQQDASRKLKWNASTTMRVAQTLYESGYITYMRTDSTNLSGQAISAARKVAVERYGEASIPEKPRFYAKKQKSAQEAHEAIRPSGDHFRSPESLADTLSAQQVALYRLIFQRTVASQMVDAVGFTATVKVDVNLTEEVEGYSVASGSTSGTVITDPGFQQLYRESKDKSNGAKASGKVEEQDLPQVSEGEGVGVTEVEAEGHRTTPPGRYTEATLVKAMEDLGIGRPSTYAATIQTIGDRGYVTHRGQYLVPTWLAFSVTRLLVENLSELVDYQFTASMEADLDHVAAGETAGTEWLKQFYFGQAGPGAKEVEGEEAKVENPVAVHGLRHAVENLGVIDAREVNSVDVAPGVVLRIGRYGPYLQHEDGRRCSVPPTVAPDEMTPELADELLTQAASDGRELGVHPETGHMIIVKNGRFGPYITEVLPEPAEVEGEEKPAKKTAKSKTAPKPKTASLFSSMDISTVTLEDAVQLMSLPREVGKDPESGDVITAQNGPYGPYLKKGRDTRPLPSEESLLTVTLEEAVQLYAQPKTRRGAGSVKTALREFGEDPVTKRPVVVKDGRFGPYVTDGQTNATVPRSETVEGLTAERAYTLLADRRDKAPAAKKAPARKPATRKPAARKPAAKRAAK
ncbi:type I DNA topoisomerase [Actinomyces minihominis]|uniref:type I DNA topoisomerase n=1 Tax=Actinomyces minihominis TaxID=2002838 RepID=UPI000C08A97A|nr:type I DNA topoisomerase [Actinomyces minihominis]